MKFSLALLPFLCAATAAQAQLSAYGTVTVRRMTGVTYTQGTITHTDGTFDPVGATGGLFYDFRTIGPVRLGIDARGSFVNSNQGSNPFTKGSGGRIYTGLAGVRASFHTPFAPLKPYVQGSAGFSASDYGVPAAGKVVLSSNVEYGAFAGLDIAILPVVDFRLVELGYGALQGNSHTYPVGTISTGLVFHLPFGLGK